ncbi:hypothetical protein Q4485_05335 [Granulosicoccaceae sp. 1_MG-2023]|nr:hypothetical protein [Granulosicoccaceae sp. 1_MG-2023]
METTKTLYMVLFIGEVRHGITADTLKHRLATRFNVRRERIERLFDGRPQIIKRDIPEATAQKYCDAVKELGGVSWIEPVPPFYGRYVDRRKNPRNRRSAIQANERRTGPRGRMGQERRARSGRRYHDR